MRILCTGGAGFVGSMLVPTLLADGHDVTVLDSFLYHQTPFNHLCAIPQLTIIKGDARDLKVIQQLLDEADIIIPLAALVGAPLCEANREAAISTNYHAIKTMAVMARPEQKFIVPITNSGYGIGEPGKECTEDTPMRPISLYGQTKVNAENALFENHPYSVSLRLATVFGASPRMRLDLLVNDFTYKACTDRALIVFEGGFKRNYVHVRDVVRAFLFAIDNFDKMRGKAFNVGLSDANLSKLELCAKIKEHIPEFVFMEAPIGKDPDQRDYVVSNAKIERLGFKPLLSLDDGITELIKCYSYLRNSIYGNV